MDGHGVQQLAVGHAQLQRHGEALQDLVGALAQQVDADHPIKALPMLLRIFTQDVASISLEDALLITKLVAYHDLVGGILYSGRRLNELLNVITSERELDMLIGLGKADSTAINPDWLNENLRARLREAVMTELNRPAVLHPFN